MSFIEQFKSRFTNNDEAEFERAFREGSWPEGVEDFEPMQNTGSFLPTKPDIDPLADESLPGNRMRRAAEEAAKRPGGVHDVYAAPVEPSPFDVIGADGRPLQQEAPAGGPLPDGADPGRADVRAAAASIADDAAESGVRVMERTGRRAPASQTAASKPFAERLRERVAAANVLGDEPPAASPQGRKAAAEPSQAGRSDMWNARKVARGDGPSRRDDGRRSEKPSLAGGAEATDSPERPKRRPPAPASTPVAAVGSADAVALRCEVVRPRLYEDVSAIADAAVGRHRPVVIVLSGSPADTSRRVLDFAFGLCCGTGAQLTELGHRVYALLPTGTALRDDDLAQLKRSGVMIRG